MHTIPDFCKQEDEIGTNRTRQRIFRVNPKLRMGELDKRCRNHQRARSCEVKRSAVPWDDVLSNLDKLHRCGKEVPHACPIGYAGAGSRWATA